MTKPKSSKPAAAAPQAAADPVNSEQAEALEATESLAAGPDTGELEERAVAAEDRAEAAERRADGLEEQVRRLNQQMQVLLRAARQPHGRTDADPELEAGEAPELNEELPYGTVYGDTEIMYVQNGYQFAPDKSFVRREINRGAGRPFNHRLVGVVKPRPGQTSADALAGFRDE